ncbi:UPF0655 protein [Escovopsis weberi]|uniref:UPF0655 protein n=1 Tax=Escovopsis weberi TaxID=150374 RepID=A0A0M9VVK0_ESCWE|nr:UPF0655 protein [Escovopsis weberi]
MNLVLDFDGTITTRDTVYQLASAAIAAQKRATGADLQPQWDAILRGYHDDLAAFDRRYRPAEADRTDVEEELRYLAQLSVVEAASIERVEAAGIFAGLAQADLFGMGAGLAADGTVALRAGLRELLGLAGRQGWRASVLSVNWSGAFIRGVLHGHGIECGGVAVVANELDEQGRVLGPEILLGGKEKQEGEGEGEGEDRRRRRLMTAADKGECLARMTGGSASATLYVGDSPTDLACLLHGRGVAIAEDAGSALMKTLARVGVRVPPVADGDALAAQGKGPGGVDISWARDFRDILQSEPTLACRGTKGPVL